MTKTMTFGRHTLTFEVGEAAKEDKDCMEGREDSNDVRCSGCLHFRRRDIDETCLRYIKLESDDIERMMDRPEPRRLATMDTYFRVEPIADKVTVHMGDFGREYSREDFRMFVNSMEYHVKKMRDIADALES